MQEMQGRTTGIIHAAWNTIPDGPAILHTWQKPGGRVREGANPDAARRPDPRAPIAGTSGPGESKAQRTDRLYAELLQEVRIAQAGIQILFGALIYLSVTPAFSGSTAVQRALYCLSLLSAIGAAGTLLAPAALHRFMHGHRVKRQLVTATHRHLMSGLVFLALAISSALTLVLDMALGGTAAFVGGSGALAWFILLWVLAPLRARSDARTIKAVPAGLLHTGLPPERTPAPRCDGRSES
ncbi:DUF6328 family protein [Streptomyces sp. NPDC002306]